VIEPARTLYDSLASWSDLQALINNGEAEGPYLECKAVGEPRLQQGQRGHLAQALSGFGNTGGGVIIWGISTTKHGHSGLDMLTELEAFGNSRSFQQQVDVAIPTLAYPAIAGCVSKTIHPTKGATKGVVITYIPRTQGDPVQALGGDKKFWLRSGADFVEMPYDIVKRMFAATTSPDLQPIFNEELVTKDAQGVWTIPIVIKNLSSAAAQEARINVVVKNPKACERISAVQMEDQSSFNPGQVIYMAAITTPIYRGLNFVAGSLQVAMKKGKRPLRVLNLDIRIYAGQMRARGWTMTIQLAKKGFSVKKTHDRNLY
jgi:hypothetical protein